MTNDEHWSQTLDLYEAGLARHALTLTDGEATGSNPWPPSSLPTGPIPAHLRYRAAELLGQSVSLSDSIAGRLASLDQPRRPRRAPRATTEHPRLSMSL